MNGKKTLNIPARKNWIDFIKVLATFMIVFIHSISTIWTTTPPDTALWKISHGPFLFARSCVLLFFMCSGSTIFRREHSIFEILTKNIFQLLKVYFFWMLIYGIKACISLYNEGLASFRTCFNAIVKSVLFGQYHTWFILTLVMLYLITPFLYLIVQNKKHTEYFMVLSIIFTIFIPALRSFEALSRLSDALSNFNMAFVVGYVLYFVAGYYITQVDWIPRYTRISALLFIISFGTAYFLTMQDSIRTGIATFEIFADFSPLTFLVTISFFGTIRGLENISFPPLFSKITTFGLGIYLMHPLFLEYMKPISDFKIFIAIPLFYLFCVLICWLLNKSKLLSYLFLK